MSDSLPKQKKLIAISEAAKVLGVSIDTIRRWDKSGILHSERPDGKNRYFSLNELEKHKFCQPLPISEVAKKLNISATTLRRVEIRGLIKPKRNNAGERVYDKESLKSFLNSDYFLRKKQIKEKILESFQKEKGLIEGIAFENETQHPERRNLVSNVGNPPSAETPERIHSASKLKPLQWIPEFLGIVVIFLLLLAIGITNITASTTKNPNPSSVLSIKSSDPSPTPITHPSPTPTLSPTPSPIPSPIPSISKPKIMLAIEIKDGKESINIHQKPTTNSEKIGQARDGDTFEFVSLNLGWYEVNLADGSTGFISAKYINIGEIDN